MLNTIQDAITSRFKTTDLGTASWILSIRAHHDIAVGTLFIDQSQYLKIVLSCFGMSDCTPVAIPLPAGKNFTPASSSEHTSVSSCHEPCTATAHGHPTLLRTDLFETMIECTATDHMIFS